MSKKEMSLENISLQQLAVQKNKKALAVSIDLLSELGIASGIDKERMKATIKLYGIALDGLSAEELEEGVLKVIKNHSYSNMPTPGEVYKACKKSGFRKVMEGIN